MTLNNLHQNWKNW